MFWALSVDDSSNTTSTPLWTTETNIDSKEIEDDTVKNDACLFHTSPRNDTIVESNFEEICIPGVIGNTSNVDPNIDSGERIITLIPKNKMVRPP